MTWNDLLVSVHAKLQRSGSNRISGPDILQSVLDVIGYFTTQLADIIPLWTTSLTFQTDGSDAGKFCRYPDTSGKNRLFETKVDDNINNAPPSNPTITENSFWKEVSASTSAAIPEWSAGVYGPGLVIVYHNHSTDGRALYVLLDPTRPYSSSDIEAEITAGDWQKLSGSGGGADFVYKETPTPTGDPLVYTLSDTPAPGSEHVFIGILLKSGGGNDYTLIGNTLTFATAPDPGDAIQVTYQRIGGGGGGGGTGGAVSAFEPWNASSNTIPVDADAIGSGTAGAIRQGDTFYFSNGGDFDPDGTGSDFWPPKTEIKAKQDSPTLASHYLFR